MSATENPERVELATTPPTLAVEFDFRGCKSWSIRESGDTIGVVHEAPDGLQAMRLGAKLGVFETLTECATAMQAAEEAEMAARRAKA